MSTYAANLVLSSTQITFVLLRCARNLSSLLCLPAMISSKIPKFASAFGDRRTCVVLLTVGPESPF